MNFRTPVALMVVVALLGGCGDDSDDSDDSATRPTSPPTTSAAPASLVVGRWEQTQSCDQLIAAFKAADLADVAPGWATNYFPNSSGKRLAKKGEHICDGAEAVKHSHFFSPDGEFGSLDQNGERVDDGQYEVVDDDTMTIGEATFTYRIENGDLVLQPVITDAEREAAHADPYEYTTAGWAVSVANGGLPFHSAPCGDWC
jgi:hypothetical protein